MLCELLNQPQINPIAPFPDTVYFNLRIRFLLDCVFPFRTEERRRHLSKFFDEYKHVETKGKGKVVTP
jgi:hypothetical protein